MVNQSSSFALPLARVPVHIAVVDDDEPFRDMLRAVLPEHWRVDVFQSADEFLAKLDQAGAWANAGAQLTEASLQSCLADRKSVV